MSDKKVALVTGGRRGIGLGIAHKLAQEGCNLVISALSDPSAAADAIVQLEALGVEAHYCQADIGESQSHVHLIESIRERFGRLDVLVNNAGVAPHTRSDILEADEESFDRLIRINLKGPYFLTQVAANWMVEQKKAHAEFKGCIINISSISATVASVNRGDYCISKAGGAMATQLWAARLAEFGISVYEIRPGIIATDMTSGVKEKYDRLIKEGLLVEPRWGSPEDIGKAVAMLVRGDLPYASGQVLTQDGGLTLARL